MDSIFITGASGCVGHYLVDQLSPDYHLYLLVRNPDRLKFNPSERKNITIIQGDLEYISEQTELLRKMDYCIHVATVWGGEQTERINVQRSHELFNLLNPEKVKRVIYFSTASIIDRNLRALKEAEEFGTKYIRTKYRCYNKLPESRIAERIVTVFPTLVFGGNEKHPYSHLTKALPIVKKYSWLLGRISIEARFHFIHAHDIAAIVRYLIEVPEVEANYVLGNEAITLGEFTRKVAKYFGYKIGWQLRLKPQTIYRLAKLFRAEISEWDKFCLKHCDFSYPVTNCHSLGIKTEYGSIEEILSKWETT